MKSDTPEQSSQSSSSSNQSGFSKSSESSQEERPKKSLPSIDVASLFKQSRHVFLHSHLPKDSYRLAPSSFQIEGKENVPPNLAQRQALGARTVLGEKKCE